MSEARTVESIELATSIVRGTNYSKEMRKWDLPKSKGGHNADGFEAYPWMLYKAQKINGKHLVFKPEPPRESFPTDDQWRRSCEMVAQFNQSQTRTVNNPDEHEKARRDGWRDNPTEALAFLDGLENDIAKAAAHRAYEDRNLSEKAKAEVAKIDAEHFEHLPEIPEQPIKRRGRPRKAEAV